MTLHSLSNPATPDIDGLKRTKAFCEAIANNPAAYTVTERKAAEVMAGQMRHWIFNASEAPNQAYGTAVSAQMAKHRLDGLKVSGTPKLEELIEGGELMKQQLTSQVQLLTDIAEHVEQLKLPADLKARLLAEVFVQAKEEAQAEPSEKAVSKVA